MLPVDSDYQVNRVQHYHSYMQVRSPSKINCLKTTLLLHDLWQAYKKNITQVVSFKGGTSRLLHFFNKPCQSSPSLTILVPLWFIIIPLVFSYLSTLFFSGFLQFKDTFFFTNVTFDTMTEQLAIKPTTWLELLLFCLHNYVFWSHTTY